VAYFYNGSTSFLLQNYYVKEFAENFMMYMLVKNVEDWWIEIQKRNIPKKYSVKISPPALREWKMRDFILTDPSGVLWRVAENRA
jgi:hypothetical protein